MNYKFLISRLKSCVFTVIDPQLAGEAAVAIQLLTEELDAYKKHGLEPCDYAMVRTALDDCAAAKEQLSNLVGLIGAENTDDLRTITSARKDGRLILPPCKVGDMVWVVFANGIRPYVVDRIYILANNKLQIRMRHMLTETLRLSEDQFGKTAFLSQEEAEATLKGGES